MGKKLLVVVDMQNDFIDGALGTKEAQAIVGDVADYIKKFDGDIICTKDTHYKNYLQTQEGKNLPIEHCMFGSHGWHINDDIMSALKGRGGRYKHITQDKISFADVTLGMRIGKYDVYDEVELCGLCTDICVISNALLIKSFAPEVRIKVHRNLCAGVTPESHETALKAMSACQIEIVD